VRAICGILAAGALLVTAPAFGEDEAPPEGAVPRETLAYTTPAEAKPLRALLELGAVFTLGFAWYATSAPTVQHWDPGYRWSTFREKLTGVDLSTDANSFGTNFIGHPLGGTGYYLSARSNRLTIAQSFGIAVAGSLLWEMFGEVSEVVSTNDMIVTPLAGLSIGEATTQLAAHFDRSGPSGAHRVLGAVFGPFKTMNDALDGLEPARAPRGVAGSDWHRFRLEAASTFAYAEPSDPTHQAWWPEVRAEASSEIVHLPDFGRSGRAGGWFDDGNASRIRLTASGGSSGLSDLAFETLVVLAGGYYRSRYLDGAGNPWGGNGLLGFSSGFQYTLHQYRRDEGRAMDRIASVQPLGVTFHQQGALGVPRIATTLELGPDFGAVTPVALRGFSGLANQLPPVQAQRGYYFAVGGHLRAAVTLTAGPVELGGEFRAEGFKDVSGSKYPNPVSLADTLATFGGSLGYRHAETNVTPRAFVERRVRAGRVAEARESVAETTLGLGIGAIF
jgi:hypothetical protein